MPSIDTPTTEAARVGVVVIGRNEGERLKRCIASVQSAGVHVVYVDSASTDGSADWARTQGVSVVALDMTRPFTAARARNAGVQHLLSSHPHLALVQFVDGDCEMDPAWLPMAVAFMGARPEVVVVSGRLRERHPEHSIYNRLCDAEWDAPEGPATVCGGIALMRVAAFRAAGGFREDLISGEEPELCVRLRAGGGKVWRLAVPMALHDAAMRRFGQWWRRTVRGGHGFAEGASLHGAPPERHYVAETRRAIAWGVALPLAALVLSVLIGPAGLLLLMAYPLQWLRLAWRERQAGRAPRLAWERSLFLVLARFPEAQGVLTFGLNRLRRRRAALMEYK
jgi:GT2 family glycosyltransferase